MNYRTYEVSIAIGENLKFIECVACDMAAAHADIAEIYGGDVEIVSTRVL